MDAISRSFLWIEYSSAALVWQTKLASARSEKRGIRICVRAASPLADVVGASEASAVADLPYLRRANRAPGIGYPGSSAATADPAIETVALFLAARTQRSSQHTPA